MWKEIKEKDRGLMLLNFSVQNFINKDCIVLAFRKAMSNGTDYRLEEKTYLFDQLSFSKFP